MFMFIFSLNFTLHHGIMASGEIICLYIFNTSQYQFQLSSMFCVILFLLCVFHIYDSSTVKYQAISESKSNFRYKFCMSKRNDHSYHTTWFDIFIMEVVFSKQNKWFTKIENIANDFLIGILKWNKWADWWVNWWWFIWLV